MQINKKTTEKNAKMREIRIFAFDNCLLLKIKKKKIDKYLKFFDCLMKFVQFTAKFYVACCQRFLQNIQNVLPMRKNDDFNIGLFLFQFDNFLNDFFHFRR